MSFRLFNNTPETPLGKAAIFVKMGVIVASIFLFIMSGKIFLDYTEIALQNEQAEKNILELQNKKEELEYYLDAPVDETYIRKFAKEKYGLVPANEKIYLTGHDKQK